MLNLPTSTESFRYALGTYYSRLSGPLQTLHKLLQPAPASGAEALALVDLFNAECHSVPLRHGRWGGVHGANASGLQVGTLEAVRPRANTPHRGRRGPVARHGGAVSCVLNSSGPGCAAHLDHTAPSGSGSSSSLAAALSVNRDEQRTVRAQLSEPHELAVLAAARAELAKAVVDSFALQSIFVQSYIHILCRRAQFELRGGRDPKNRSSRSRTAGRVL